MAPKPAEREIEVEDDDDLTAKTQALLGNDQDDDDDLDTGTDEKAPTKDEADQEDDRRLAYDEDDGDGPEERGTSRRARRNKARREARDQSRAVILAQEERIRRLEGAIGDMGRAQLGLHAGDIDGQIGAAQGQLEQIDSAMADAMANQDAVKFRRAIKLRDEANQRLAILGTERRRLEAVAQQGQFQQQRPAATDPNLGMVDVDPEAERLSNIFMDRHPWFDPKDNTDEDSQIVKSIDDTLVNQGYKPNTSRYWKELERRVEARGLGSDDQGEDDDRNGRDYREERPPARRNSGGLPPRSRRGAGGGRPAGGGDRDLPPLARETLDQLGLLDKKGLDKDQLAERESYIKTWRAGLAEAAKSQRQSR